MSESKKPRLAEALGVEVGEKLLIDGRNRNPYSVTDEGFIVDRDGGVCYEVVTYLFNHPNRLIREPRWTEQEVEDAKTFRRMWPDGEIKFDRWLDGRCCLTQIRGSLNGCLGLGEVDLFPSVKPGQTVKLDDIIGGNE